MTVLDEIARERQRQVDGEGFDEEHDDKYRLDELSRAAGAYILSPLGWLSLPAPEWWLWPWDMKWWKPTTRRRDLIKAAALIVAEIGRMDRAAKMTTYFNEITLVLQRSELVVLIAHYRGLAEAAAEDEDYLAAHQAKLRADGLAKIMEGAHD